MDIVKYTSAVAIDAIARAIVFELDYMKHGGLGLHLMCVKRHSNYYCASIR